MINEKQKKAYFIFANVFQMENVFRESTLISS